MPSARPAGVSRGLRRAILITAGLWGAGAVAYVGLASMIARMFGPLDILLQIGTSALCGVIAFGLYGAFQMSQAWPRWRAWPLIAGCVVLIALMQAALDIGAILTIGETFVPGMKAVYGTFDRVWYARTAFIYFWIDWLTLALLLLSIAIERARRQERALAEAQLAAQQAQLAALRFQLNPHFLFNTLNAISTLVIEAGATEAEAMIAKLCDFLRASLAAEPGDVIPLEDELETLQAYLDIESVRFGDRLAVEFACAPGLGGAQVPSLLLQPLAENAVKYAVAPARRTVTIRISASREGDNLVLVVADDGDKTEGAAASYGAGVGLGNVRRRLETLYGTRGVLETFPGEDGFLALIRMPLSQAEAGRPTAVGAA